MKYSENIFIPLICPIQFLEPREQVFYKKQEYIGSIITDTYLQIFIDQTLYASDTDITMVMKDSRTRVPISSTTLTKRVLLAAVPGVDGFYFIDGVLPKGDETRYVFFELYHGTILLADSINYCLNPYDDRRLKTITFTHYENDYNTVFLFGSVVKTLSLTVECGFIPNDFQSKTQREDFEQQDMMNDLVSSRPYVIEPITFGTSKGIPNWLAHKLNIIFLLSDVKIEGETVVRASGAEMELVERTNNGLGVYKLNLQSFEDNYLPFRIFNNVFDNPFS